LPDRVRKGYRVAEASFAPVLERTVAYASRVWCSLFGARRWASSWEKGGERATFKAQGVGKLLDGGAVSYRRTSYYYSDSTKLSRLNVVAIVSRGFGATCLPASGLGTWADRADRTRLVADVVGKSLRVSAPSTRLGVAYHGLHCGKATVMPNRTVVCGATGASCR
jgi:hypothetical protein